MKLIYTEDIPEILGHDKAKHWKLSLIYNDNTIKIFLENFILEPNYYNRVYNTIVQSYSNEHCSYLIETEKGKQKILDESEKIVGAFIDGINYNIRNIDAQIKQLEAQKKKYIKIVSLKEKILNKIPNLKRKLNLLIKN